jgi:hypothetical protein
MPEEVGRREEPVRFRPPVASGTHVRASGSWIRHRPPALPRQDSRELPRVRGALEGRKYAALKSSDPKTAARVREALVAALGVYKDTDLPPLASLLGVTGPDASPRCWDA